MAAQAADEITKEGAVDSMKLTLIGGGSVRTFYFMESLLKFCNRLKITELSIMDNDPVKLRIFGGFAVYMSEHSGAPLHVDLTGDLHQAVSNASFVVTTIRVGQDEMRCKDERIALNHGIIGQETTGAGGYSYACRSIPAMLTICKAIREYACEGCITFNFTNPSGLVTQAMHDAGYEVIGICDNATGIKMDLAHALRIGAGDLFVRVYGLNHLSWADRVEVCGEDILPKLIDTPEFLETFHQFAYFDRDLIRSMKKIPNGYLYYFYHREKALKNILASSMTRGETIHSINERMMAELTQMDIRIQPEEMLAVYHRYMHEREGSYMQMETGGFDGQRAFDVKSLHMPILEKLHSDQQVYEGYAGVAFNYIESVVTGRPIDLALCVPNHGAIDGMDDDDVVEVTCMVNQNGAKPVHIGSIPEDEYLLTRMIKRYEKLTVAAVREKSLELGTQALMQHPLVGSYSLAKSLAAEYARINEPYAGLWR